MRALQPLARPQTWLLAVTLGATVTAGVVGWQLGQTQHRQPRSTGWDIYYAQRDCMLAKGWQLDEGGSSYFLGDTTLETRNRFNRDALVCARYVGAVK